MVEAPLFIDDTAASNLMDMHAKLRRLKAGQGLGLVVVDYLQLMSGRGRFGEPQPGSQQISRGMKLLAKELNVPFLVLSQLSRAPETRQGDHRPQLSDLRESGSIEQDADLVGFIFREEVYKPQDASLQGQAELILAKQRNGPVGKIDLVFLQELTKFENRASIAPRRDPARFGLLAAGVLRTRCATARCHTGPPDGRPSKHRPAVDKAPPGKRSCRDRSLVAAR
jgi:replicative DNA helicase